MTGPLLTLYTGRESDVPHDEVVGSSRSAAPAHPSLPSPSALREHDRRPALGDHLFAVRDPESILQARRVRLQTFRLDT